MSGITGQSMTKLTGRDDWGTPKDVVDYIERNYALCKFEIDACASEYNHKCENYITKEMDMFRFQFKKNTFMNPIYGKKGFHRVYDKEKRNPDGSRVVLQEWFNKYGTEDFVRFARDQHFKHKKTWAVLLFANVSSSEYFEQWIGETPDARAANHCELFFYPRRIEFENPDGSSVGTPSLSSMVVVYDERFKN